MQITCYNSEKYDRSTWWYIIFGTILSLLIAVSIWRGNLIGAIFLFLFVGCYLYFDVAGDQKTVISTTQDGVRFGEKLYGRQSFQGFVLEFDKDQNVKNIIFIGNNFKKIHTVMEVNDDLRAFLDEMEKNIPVLDNFPQSGADAILRKLKL